MKKGIVLEVHDDYVTMLTPEGEFLKSRKQKTQVGIGEEVIFFPLHTSREMKKRGLATFFKLRWAIVTVLTAAILLFSFYPKYMNNQVYAYVSLDVNPSIELSLNKKMQVVSIVGYNEEGKKLVKNLQNWENEGLMNVSTQILDIIRQQGYLTSGSEVIIASVLSNSDNLAWKKKIQTEILSISQTIQIDDISVTMIETTSEKRGEAIKLGISPGEFVQKEKNIELVDSDNTSKQDEKSTETQGSNVNGSQNVIKNQDLNKASNNGIVENKKARDRQTERNKNFDHLTKEQKEKYKQEKEKRKEHREQKREEWKKNPDKMKKEWKEKNGDQKHDNKEWKERKGDRKPENKEWKERKDDRKQDNKKQNERREHNSNNNKHERKDREHRKNN
ncbi:anti-sigma factor domain-containing protein [Sutcliffiella halmapala]|uniref:anti-sigma factor domain-containing protein n=1 Tax=Sutcliffiella halmapala TaxID=79882 RepID=UPI000995213A|nr:anti-sigma factor domain-containing protein [Sutcliffiella halmapala]